MVEKKRMNMERVMNSEYMKWAKTQSGARFNLASSDMLHFPLAELPVKLQGLEINGPGGYGNRPLLNSIAGVCNVTPENIVTSFGTSLANHIAMAAVIQPGDEVLIEEPVYELLTSTLGYLGARVTSFPRRFEQQFVIDPDEVKHAMTSKTKLIVITNLHNPSSAYTNEETLKEIGKYAERVGARVLVDEVYLNSMFEEKPRSAFHLGNQFITTNSLTKVYGLSGLRCGWILAEPPLAEKMWRLTDLFHSSSVHVAEQLSVIAFNNIHRLTTRARTLLEANQKILNDFFASRNDLLSIRHEHGLVSFPKLRSGNVESFCRLLREKYETTVVPGKFFNMPEHFRMSIGKERGELEEGIARLSSALDELRR
jgi:aspartate/methionine/tyrosine aminotransferase